MNKSRTHGFTLIELLVVIAIIGVLISILLPALTGVQRAAERVDLMSNVRSIGQGYAMYMTDSAGRLPTDDRANWNTTSSHPGNRYPDRHEDAILPGPSVGPWTWYDRVAYYITDPKVWQSKPWDRYMRAPIMEPETMQTGGILPGEVWFAGSDLETNAAFHPEVATPFMQTLGHGGVFLPESRVRNPGVTFLMTHENWATITSPRRMMNNTSAVVANHHNPRTAGSRFSITPVSERAWGNARVPAPRGWRNIDVGQNVYLFVDGHVETLGFWEVVRNTSEARYHLAAIAQGTIDGWEPQ